LGDLVVIKDLNYN